ncbi:MAG: class I SAM-dependent methyltransferase [Clostridiales bacterium]|nr:class I SAM-dependent methyltransferase [Clostridiales bacterium]
MNIYSGFAEVYDTFMDNVPYEEWCDYICGLLSEHGVKDGLVLDLGCGTGVMTRLLADRGYDMIGVDVSAEMLAIARSYEDRVQGEIEHVDESMADSECLCGVEPRSDVGDRSAYECMKNADAEAESRIRDILYIQQDMRELELYGTVRAAVCLCDSLNYILEEEELRQVFSLVRRYLDPQGIFIFDMNTVYKYREILGETDICENRERECFTWENYFDEESAINEYVINIFKETENGFYRRYEEVHYQKAYEVECVKRLIEEAGLSLLAVYGEGSREAPEPECERVYFVAENVSSDDMRRTK